MTARFVRGSRVAAAALAALALACTQDRLTEPPPVRAVVPTSASVEILLTTTANYSLPIARGNTQGLGWTPTAIQLGAGQPARVTVTGALQFVSNPLRVIYFGPPPVIPSPIGPAGTGYPWSGSEQVLARIRRPDGSVFQVA